MTGKVDRDGFPMDIQLTPKGGDKPKFEFVGSEDPVQMDISGASDVGIQIRHDGTVIWINVDGICKLRVCRIDKLTVEDNRPDPEPPIQSGSARDGS